MKAVTFTLLFFALSVSLYASQQRKTLTLRLQSPTGNSANATLYFDQGIVPSYDIHQDAKMIFSNVPEIPEIYSYTLDKVPCSINGCGTLQKAETVHVGYTVGFPGNYTITASSISNFDPTSIITLVDNKLGLSIDLRENFYQVQLDSTDLTDFNRFYIQISSAVQYASTPSNCANTGGTITLTPDSSITWGQCQLIDSSNHIVQTFDSVTGQIKFTGLAAGTYHVVYTYGQYTATNVFFLNGNYVTASIGVPAGPIYINEDVVFDAITTNSVNYNWSLGDGTLIIGVAHPTQRYLVPGTYTVDLLTSNDVGCSASAQATVTVLAPSGISNTGKKEAIIYSDSKQVVVNMNDISISQDAQIAIYNLLGQVVSLTPLTSQTQNISLASQSTGYYLVSIRNSGLVNTKRVLIDAD